MRKSENASALLNWSAWWRDKRWKLIFQRCLAASRGTAPEARTDFRRGVYEQIRQVDGQQGELTVERMCTLAAVSRASYYRPLGPQPANDEEESRLRDDMQRIALANRHYGYRRITHALRAQGWEINHKRVARLMRLDNLLAIRKRRFAPVTTDSKHDLEVSNNVARRLKPTSINQLWVANITYVRLGRVDVFLAVVLDAFSRKVIGWNVAPSLAATFPAAPRPVSSITPTGACSMLRRLTSTRWPRMAFPRA